MENLENTGESVYSENNAGSSVDNRGSEKGSVESSSSYSNRDVAADSPKMMTQAEHQAELNRVVGAVKLKERERAEKMQHEQSYSNGQQANQQMQGSIDIASEVDKVIRARQEEHEAKEAHARAKDIIYSFSEKIMSGKDKYADFDEKISTVDLGNPDLVMSMHELENVADVLYALGEDQDTYLSVVQGLSSKYTTAAAKTKIRKLAQRLKNGEEASRIHNTSKIPDRIKSSPLNNGNGKPSYLDMVNSKDYGW